MKHAIPHVDSELVGPPQAILANPTVILFSGALATFAASTAAALLGAIPLVLGAALNVLCLYSFYTVNHEAVHRIAHRNAAANEWMGRLAAALEGITFPLFRVIHLQHHAHTNHPERDPDFVIGRKPRWLLPIWTIIRLTHDNVFAVRRGLWTGRRPALVEHLLTVGLQGAAVVGFALAGRFAEVVALWLAPVAIAGAAIELTVAWAVHYPHESQHPLENTRMFRGLLWQVLTLNQSYHLVHHLWARIPWFKYGAALEVANAALEEHERTLAASSRA